MCLRRADRHPRRRTGHARSAGGTRTVDRLLAALGIDAAQFRALARVYVPMDFRAAGGATRRHSHDRKPGSPLAGLLVVSGIGSLAFGAIAGTMADALIAASLLTTYGAANTMMLLLVDFTGVVLSPDDYGILGPRPIGSALPSPARPPAPAGYAGATRRVLASVPAVVLAVRFGWAALPATLLAVL